MAVRINVDGQLGGAEDRLLSPLDQGFLFGASVYETVRTYGGRVFLLERHLARLRASAEALGIELDLTDDIIRTRVGETLDAAANPESSIRIVVSAGAGAIDYGEDSTNRPTVVIIVRPLPEFPESLYRDGAAAAIVSIMRAAPGNLDPRIKSSNLVNNRAALRRARKSGAYEALLLNTAGDVCEGSMSNVFFVKQNTVVTPPVSAGILEGITRELVIAISRAADIPLEERPFRPAELLDADEVFITASSRQIVPIVRIDDHAIADERPGPVTKKLIQSYQAKVRALMRGASV